MTESLIIFISLLFYSSYFYYKIQSSFLQNIFLLVISFVTIIYFSPDNGANLVLSFVITILGLYTRKNKIVSTAFVLSLLLVLVANKYLYNYNPQEHLVNPNTILIPLGISFFTFQLASLVIDFQRSPQKNLPDITSIALYASYIPQLVAGPIESGQKLITQFNKKRTFSVELVREGLFLSFKGIFKKAVFANALFISISSYTEATDLSYVDLFLLAIIVRYYIFFSFSAYTDMALGTSLFFGIHLTQNFNSPLNSRTLTEFWTKWHITLGTWVKNYIFFPLSLNLIRRAWPNGIAIIVSFLVIGLWHDFSLAFVAYGLFQGFIILLEDKIRMTRFRWEGYWLVFNYIYRYLVIFLPSLVFFFSTEDILDMLKNTNTFLNIDNLFSQIKIPLLIISFEGLQYLENKYDLRNRTLNCSKTLHRWLAYSFLVFLLFIIGSYEEDAMFLYFNF